MNEKTNTIRACGVRDLVDGELRAVEAAPQPLGICRSGDQWFAFANNCTHEDFPLTEGGVDQGEIECPLHGAKFCLKTGAVRAIPATEPIAVFPVRIVGTDVLIDLPTQSD